MRMILVLVAVAVLVSALPCAAETLTYVDLVKRLTDLEGLAVLPAQGETCAQWSSYDRASRYDEATGKYVGWDANGDGGGIIRKEGDSRSSWPRWKGPGCIWRIWSARAEGGAREDLPRRRDRAGGRSAVRSATSTCKNEPFDYPGARPRWLAGAEQLRPDSLSRSPARSWRTKDWGAYYQFTYTTFPKGTIVPTFKRDLSAGGDRRAGEGEPVPDEEPGHGPGRQRTTSE